MRLEKSEQLLKLALMMQDKDLEIVEQDTQEFPILDPMGMPVLKQICCKS
jgi:hypothetical protein